MIFPPFLGCANPTPPIPPHMLEKYIINICIKFSCTCNHAQLWYSRTYTLIVDLNFSEKFQFRESIERQIKQGAYQDEPSRLSDSLITSASKSHPKQFYT